MASHGVANPAKDSGLVTSPRLLGLAARTLPGVTPEQAIALTAQAGFDCLGALFAPERSEREWQALRHQADAAGIRYLDVEPIRIREGTLDANADRVLAAAAILGAQFVLVIGHDTDHAATAAALRQLCERAAPLGLRLALEFMPFRGVATLQDGLAVVSMAAHRAAMLLIDNHHLLRTAGHPAQLAALDPGQIAYAQICDLPADRPVHPSLDEIMHEALERRIIPGQGSLDLAEFTAALPSGTPLSIEILGAAPRAGFVSDLAYAQALRHSLESIAWLAERSP